mgnify:CR=1 FL=1
MKNKNLHTLLLLPLLAVCLLWTSGCATRLDSSISPGANLAKIESVFVKKLPADGRGIERLIAIELNSMGYKAVHGTVMPTDQVFDAIVEYQDKWMWDMTMYMLELRMQIIEPTNRFTIATGESYRTSLARKTPENMVKEVLGEIFK